MNTVVIFHSCYFDRKRDVGGYTCMIEKNGVTSEISNCYQSTSEARIALYGLIESLEFLHHELSTVVVRTDSFLLSHQYTEKRLNILKNRNWLKRGSIVENVDLLKRLSTLYEMHKVVTDWTGDTYVFIENGLCKNKAKMLTKTVKEPALDSRIYGAG